MGTGSEEEEERDGVQQQTPLRIPGLLYVSVKMENTNLAPLPSNLFPHVCFSSSLLGPSLDPSIAVILIHTHFTISFLLFWVPLSFSYYYCCYLFSAFNGTGIGVNVGV